MLISLLLLEVVSNLCEKVTMGHLGDGNTFVEEVVTLDAELVKN